jgi:hypothetical protein
MIVMPSRLLDLHGWLPARDRAGIQSCLIFRGSFSDPWSDRDGSLAMQGEGRDDDPFCPRGRRILSARIEPKGVSVQNSICLGDHE